MRPSHGHMGLTYREVATGGYRPLACALVALLRSAVFWIPAGVALLVWIGERR